MWNRIVHFFADSETIFWARLQMLAAAVWEGVNQVGIAPALTSVGLGRWVPLALLAMGIITELLRRRRAVDL